MPFFIRTSAIGIFILLLAVRFSEAQPPEMLPSTPPVRRNPTALLPEEKPLRSIALTIEPQTGKVPVNTAQTWLSKSTHELPYYPGGNIVYYWDAPDLFHRPLYYEEVNAERHGYSRLPVMQPAVSGLHFFASTLALPYQMTVHPPRECVAPLGHYRAGNPVPYQRELPEWDPKAAVIQTMVVGGLIFIVP